jgi:hypothetical protein
MTYIVDMIKQSVKRRQFLNREGYYNFKLYMYYIKYHCNLLVLLINMAFCGVTAFLTAAYRWRGYENRYSALLVNRLWQLHTQNRCQKVIYD